MISARFAVRLWQTVTVALAADAPSGELRCINIKANGLPTMSLRPTMTTCLPLVCNVRAVKYQLNAVRRAGQKARTALSDAADVFGVESIHVFQGASPHRARALCRSTRARAVGPGCRGPGDHGSAARSAPATRVSRVSAGSLCSRLVSPTRSQARCLLRT